MTIRSRILSTYTSIPGIVIPAILLVLVVACGPPTPAVKLPDRLGPLTLSKRVILPANKQEHLRQTVIGYYGAPDDSNTLQVLIYENSNAAFAAYFSRSMRFAQVRPGASEVRFLYDKQNVIHLARREKGFYRQMFRWNQMIIIWQVRDSLAEATEMPVLNMSL